MRLTSLSLFIILNLNPVEAQIPRWTAFRSNNPSGVFYGFKVIGGTNIVESRHNQPVTDPILYHGDVITAVRSRKVADEASLFAAMDAVKQHTFKVTVNRPLRDGGTKQISVTVQRASRDTALNTTVTSGRVFAGIHKITPMSHETGDFGIFDAHAEVIGETESMHDRFGNPVFVYKIPPLSTNLKKLNRQKWEFYEKLRPFIVKDYRPNAVERKYPLLFRPGVANFDGYSRPAISCELLPDEWTAGTRVKIGLIPFIIEDEMKAVVDGRLMTVDVLSVFEPEFHNELKLPIPDDN